MKAWPIQCTESTEWLRPGVFTTTTVYYFYGEQNQETMIETKSRGKIVALAYFTLESGTKPLFSPSRIQCPYTAKNQFEVADNISICLYSQKSYVFGCISICLCCLTT